jgi:hypothetical protein
MERTSQQNATKKITSKGVEVQTKRKKDTGRPRKRWEPEQVDWKPNPLVKKKKKKKKKKKFQHYTNCWGYTTSN